jgi:Mg2+-importing ATPase
LPMLPTQILFNNLLYDASQITLPSDNVDSEQLEAPHRLNIAALRRFMVVFGVISSVFDFVTFGILYGVLHMHGGQFQLGWFLESLATQIFVVYIIRTRKVPFLESRPGLSLTISTLLAVIIGWGIALSPLRSLFGFSLIPTGTLGLILGIVAVYLVVVEGAKRTVARKLLSIG